MATRHCSGQFRTRKHHAAPQACCALQVLLCHQPFYSYTLGFPDVHHDSQWTPKVHPHRVTFPENATTPSPERTMLHAVSLTRRLSMRSSCV